MNAQQVADAWQRAGRSCRNSLRNQKGFSSESGERGIRTPGTGLTPYNGLANRRLQPLGHLSGGCGKHGIGEQPGRQTVWRSFRGRGQNAW